MKNFIKIVLAILGLVYLLGCSTSYGQSSERVWVKPSDRTNGIKGRKAYDKTEKKWYYVSTPYTISKPSSKRNYYNDDGQVNLYTIYSPNSGNKMNYGVSIAGEFIGTYIDFGSKDNYILSLHQPDEWSDYSGWGNRPMGRSNEFYDGNGHKSDEFYYNRYISYGYTNLNLGILFKIKRLNLSVGINMNTTKTYDNLDITYIHNYKYISYSSDYNYVSLTEIKDTKHKTGIDLKASYSITWDGGFHLTPMLAYNSNQGIGFGIGIGGTW